MPYVLYSLIWKELSKNVSIAWYKHCSIVYQELSENVSIVWCLKMCVVLFGSNSIKVSALLDMKSETCLLLSVVIVWNCEYFFFAKCFVTICFTFSCMYFLTIRMALIKRQSGLYLIFLKLFPATLPCLISGWKELGRSMVEFLSFIQLVSLKMKFIKLPE